MQQEEHMAGFEELRELVELKKESRGKSREVQQVSARRAVPEIAPRKTNKIYEVSGAILELLGAQKPDVVIKYSESHSRVGRILFGKRFGAWVLGRQRFTVNADYQGLANETRTWKYENALLLRDDNEFVEGSAEFSLPKVLNVTSDGENVIGYNARQVNVRLINVEQDQQRIMHGLANIVLARNLPINSI
jgi:hypothetical protein